MKKPFSLAINRIVKQLNVKIFAATFAAFVSVDTLAVEINMPYYATGGGVIGNANDNPDGLIVEPSTQLGENDMIVTAPDGLNAWGYLQVDAQFWSSAEGYVKQGNVFTLYRCDGIEKNGSFYNKENSCKEYKYAGSGAEFKAQERIRVAEGYYLLRVGVQRFPGVLRIKRGELLVVEMAKIWLNDPIAADNSVWIEKDMSSKYERNKYMFFDWSLRVHDRNGEFCYKDEQKKEGYEDHVFNSEARRFCKTFTAKSFSAERFKHYLSFEQESFEYPVMKYTTSWSQPDTWNLNESKSGTFYSIVADDNRLPQNSYVSLFPGVYKVNWLREDGEVFPTKIKVGDVDDKFASTRVWPPISGQEPNPEDPDGENNENNTCDFGEDDCEY